MYEKILIITYFAGIASCGMQGAEKIKNNQVNQDKYLICSFLSAFAGGLIRDIFFLHTYPAVFQLTSLPDIAIALIAAYMYYNKKTEFRFYFLIWADSIGLAQFIAIGVDRAIRMESGKMITFISGVTTALGGGIISSLLCHESISKILKSNITYRLCTIIGTAIYVYWIDNQVDSILAQYLLLIYTTTICNTIARDILKKIFIIQLCIIKKAFKSFILTMECKSGVSIPYYFSKPLFYLPHDSYKYNCRRIYLNYANRKIILRFHRILQM